MEGIVPDTFPLYEELVLGAGDAEGELIRGYQVDSSPDGGDEDIQADGDILLLILCRVVKPGSRPHSLLPWEYEEPHREQGGGQGAPQYYYEWGANHGALFALDCITLLVVNWHNRKYIKNVSSLSL